MRKHARLICSMTLAFTPSDADAPLQRSDPRSPQAVLEKTEEQELELALWLPLLIHHLRNRVPDRNPRPFDLLPRKPHGNTHLQRRLQLPFDIFRRCVDRLGHALQPRDQHAIGQSLCKGIVSSCPIDVLYVEV